MSKPYSLLNCMKGQSSSLQLNLLVPMAGIEPARPKTLAFETSASSNSATSAHFKPLVPDKRLELSRLATTDPKSAASANSANRALTKLLYERMTRWEMPFGYRCLCQLGYSPSWSGRQDSNL
jgi:hypothetical protein